MMLQFLKTKKRKAVYISLDNIIFLIHNLSEIIEEYYKQGIRIFGLDEVHKYPNWSIEIKNIYDNYSDIQLIITSSSALNIMTGQGDLSRRLDEYRLHGLSFYEYLRFEHKFKMPSYTWDELLDKH